MAARWLAKCQPSIPGIRMSVTTASHSPLGKEAESLSAVRCLTDLVPSFFQRAPGDHSHRFVIVNPRPSALAGVGSLIWLSPFSGEAAGKARLLLGGYGKDEECTSELAVGRGAVSV